METDISHEPIVVAIVLNYRRPLDTLACLNSIKDSSYNSLRMIVVDNASPDDSANRIRKSHPDVEVIESKSNSGYAGGMNIGIRYAMKFSPEYLLLVNSDTIIADDFIEKLIEVMNVHQRAAAVSGTIYYFSEKEKIWYAGGTMRYWRASGFTHHILPEYRRGITIDAIPVTFISGCGFLVRVSALEQVGLFNEQDSGVSTLL
ncbi:MAG: glycosyltransferase family 2 protein [Ignavibacteriales bacterium]|nr:glycosyltransferase family 2 protein [Ignavibacteriales bacterium]